MSVPIYARLSIYVHGLFVFFYTEESFWEEKPVIEIFIS